MPYYGPSIFYPIVGASHSDIIRYAAEAVRQPVFLVNGALTLLPGHEIPNGAKVALLDNDEHVVTVDPSSPSVQFSQDHQDLAVACAQKGWLEVRR